ncbi:MAG: hypothetical protein KDA52_01200 [Planctomycetaceae bacterium]|nr:hypothetical protein [Planctomycetaceae bacterium]
MTYKQVRDVVNLMRRSHQQLREVLERPRSRSGDTRTQLILEALRRDEHELQIALARHGAEGQAALLDTWLQYVPDDEIQQTLNSIDFTPEMTADEVVVRKLEFDRSIKDLLRVLAEQTAVPCVQEFFTALLENLESRMVQRAWSVREYQAGAEPPTQEA